jgi:UDP-N-acetylmuramate dehydrogenase
LSGIPGRVGATPIQNVGAYGQEISESFVSLEALDTSSGETLTMTAADCEFGYRSSRFKACDRGRFIITSVTYRLKRGGKPALRYAELQREITECGIRGPGLEDIRKAVIAIRTRKAMVIDPHDVDSQSVGSFFVNPTITTDQAEGIKSLVGELWSFPAGDGLVKVPGAWLIEQAGIARGHQRGGVAVSSKHALAIVNRGGGTAREVVELAREIKSRVLERFGVEMVPEPVFVGFVDDPLAL